MSATLELVLANLSDQGLREFCASDYDRAYFDGLSRVELLGVIGELVKDFGSDAVTAVAAWYDRMDDASRELCTIRLGARS